MSIPDDSIIKSLIFFPDDFLGKGRMKQPFYSLSTGNGIYESMFEQIQN